MDTSSQTLRRGRSFIAQGRDVTRGATAAAAVSVKADGGISATMPERKPEFRVLLPQGQLLDLVSEILEAACATYGVNEAAVSGHQRFIPRVNVTTRAAGLKSETVAPAASSAAIGPSERTKLRAALDSLRKRFAAEAAASAKLLQGSSAQTRVLALLATAALSSAAKARRKRQRRQHRQAAAHASGDPLQSRDLADAVRQSSDYDLPSLALRHGPNVPHTAAQLKPIERFALTAHDVATQLGILRVWKHVTTTHTLSTARAAAAWHAEHVTGTADGTWNNPLQPQPPHRRGSVDAHQTISVERRGSVYRAPLPTDGSAVISVLRDVRRSIVSGEAQPDVQAAVAWYCRTKLTVDADGNHVGPTEAKSNAHSPRSGSASRRASIVEQHAVHAQQRRASVTSSTVTAAGGTNGADKLSTRRNSQVELKQAKPFAVADLMGAVNNALHSAQQMRRPEEMGWRRWSGVTTSVSQPDIDYGSDAGSEMSDFEFDFD